MRVWTPDEWAREMRQSYERHGSPAGAPADPGTPVPGSLGVPAVVPGPYGALRPSDRAFRKLVEHIPAIIYVETDEHPSPTAYLNPRIQQVLGYSPEEFLADWTLWGTLIHPDDRAQAEKVNRRSDLTKEPYICEYRLRAKDGRYVWFHDEALFVEGEHGGPDYWQGVMIDITERKRAEREERDAAAKFRTLVDQIPAIVYIEGDDGSVDSPFYVSPLYERLFGYSAAERVADPDLWSKLLHPEDREPALAAARRAADTGDPFSMDYRMIARDGSVVWVHDETVLVRDDDGNPLFWQGVLFDITERKRVEGELHEAASRFQTLVEQIPAITYIDPLEKEPVPPLYLSPQIETMLGYPAERALRDPEWWVKLVHPEDRTRVLQDSDGADESGRPYLSEYRMMAADGREVWVRDESTLVRDEAGAPQYWQGVMYDITSWKKAEMEMQRALELARVAADELRQADDIKNTFLQAVSHDLRSPLTAMLGSALTLENEDQLDLSPETRRELIRSLARKTRKLTGIVTDLLDLERLTRGVVEPGRTDTDVGKLVARVVADSELLGDRAVNVDVQPAPIAVDRSMVERIVENLLANAAKHTAADAMVWVRVRPEQEGVLIIVEDEGSGVPEELRESLFAAFERGPSANPDAQGSGLGLSLVARFAALHGGRAWIEEREGGGASFRVFLPHVAGPDPSPDLDPGLPDGQ